jgi:lipopolysaccharide assembly outer membrane protein LptD (OstA)
MPAGLGDVLTDVFEKALTAVFVRARYAVFVLFAAAALTSISADDLPAAQNGAGSPVNAQADTSALSESEVLTATDTLSLTDSMLAAAADTISPRTESELADTVHYESDFIDYDNVERVLKLFGRARVRYQNITLLADTIVYTVSNDQFQARGLPTLIEGGDTTVGDFMVYNIKTRRGRVSYAMTRFDETYVTGSNIVKTRDNRLYIEQGDYTSCEDPEHPHYYFYGRHIKFIPQDKVISRPVVFNVGDAPIAVLPYFIMPLQRGRRSGWLTPSWGGSVQHGGYVDNLGYYFAPNDYYDLTLRAKAQEFNSFVFNAAGRYALRYVLDGQISGRYVIDNRLESTSQQWALDYRHNQFLTPNGKTRLSGQGSILSTNTFNQLYSDQTYELEKQQLDANMSLSHRFDRINASANVTWRRNHNLTTDRIIEDMPAIDFNLQNRAFVPFKTGGRKNEPSWYNNIYYSYNTRANVRRDVYGNDSIPGFIRPGMDHNVRLTSSQKILKYLDISPYFHMRSSMFYGAIDTLVRDTLYVRDTTVYRVRDPAREMMTPEDSVIRVEYSIDANGDWDTLYTLINIGPERRILVRDTLHNEFNTVNTWNTGVNMSTRIYGLFPMGELFGVTAIRHTMTPTVGYSFIPEHHLNRMFYPVGIAYERPRPKAQQLVNLSLSNSFQGKRIVSARDGRTGGNNNARGRSGTGGIDDHMISVIEEMLSDDEDDELHRDSLSQPDDEGSAVNNAADTVGAAPAPRARRQEQKFDLLTFSVGTSYDLEAEQRKWRDLSLSAGTSVGFLNVRHTSNYWLYDENNELIPPLMRDYSVDLTSGRLGASGKFWDGDLLNLDLRNHGEPAMRNQTGSTAWEAYFSPSFSYRARRNSPDDMFLPTKSFNVSSSASMNLTNTMSVRWNGNYDFSSNQFSHNSFTFYIDLECWEMRFTWRPEKINPGYAFVVNIKKIPDIKWEQKGTKSTSPYSDPSY